MRRIANSSGNYDCVARDRGTGVHTREVFAIFLPPFLAVNQTIRGVEYTLRDCKQ
jgi:hypothetical protein